MEQKNVNYNYNEDKERVVHFVQQANAVITESRTVLDSELMSVCKCMLSETDSFEDSKASKRKQKILSNVLTTEIYLRERHIPELIRFLTAKIMCANPKNICVYVEDLLNDCMIFRAGHGSAPVLFEERHLEAIMKSFDPSGRGWLTAGQVRRAYAVVGLTPRSNLKVKTPTPEVLNLLREAQERKLLRLLCAGLDTKYEFK